MKLGKTDQQIADVLAAGGWVHIYSGNRVSSTRRGGCSITAIERFRLKDASGKTVRRLTRTMVERAAEHGVIGIDAGAIPRAGEVPALSVRVGPHREADGSMQAPERDPKGGLLRLIEGMAGKGTDRPSRCSPDGTARADPAPENVGGAGGGDD